MPEVPDLSFLSLCSLWKLQVTYLELFIFAPLTFRPFHPSTLRTLNLDIRSLDFSILNLLSKLQSLILDLRIIDPWVLQPFGTQPMLFKYF